MKIINLLLICYSIVCIIPLSWGQISIGINKTIELSEALPETEWEMRIIEVAPTRTFFGSITNLFFTNKLEVNYHRKLHGVRGQFYHKEDLHTGLITLFKTSYPYTIKDNILYYEVNKKNVPLLKRINDKSNQISEIQQLEEQPKDAISRWLNDNNIHTTNSELTKINKYSNHKFNSDLIGSYWKLIDYTNTSINTHLIRELNFKPTDNVFLSFAENGKIIVDAEIKASGTTVTENQHVTTIILRYTDTGWNRVIGKNRLIRLELKTPDGITKNLYHLVSEDGRSIYPATIRKMGESEPSYAYINRTHVFSRLPSLIESNKN